MSTGIDNIGDDELLDPLQGFDVKIKTYRIDKPSEQQLIGAFTNLMFKVVNATEVYIPVGTRFPRHLDGEVTVVWSLEQGAVKLNVIANTFGEKFAQNFKQGRGFRVPRSRRFDISFSAAFAKGDLDGAGSKDDAIYRNDYMSNGEKYRLKYCRVDTYTFGVGPGRHVVANSWQGTAQFLTDDTASA